MEEREKIRSYAGKSPKPATVDVDNGAEIDSKGNSIVKTEVDPQDDSYGSRDDTFHRPSPSPDEDGIEVFRFDRNSLKLRCEKVSPKQLREDGNGMTKISTAHTSTNYQSRIKQEKSSDPGVTLKNLSKNSRIRGSDGNDDSNSSSNSSSSSSSSCSSSSSSSTSTSSRSSESVSSRSSSNRKNAKYNNSSTKPSSNRASCSSSSSSISSSSSSSSGSSSSSSSETDDSSDNDDELSKNSGCERLRREDQTQEVEGRRDQQRCFVKTEDVKVDIDVESISAEEPDIPEVKVNDTGWNDYIGARKSRRLPPRAVLSSKNYETQLKKKLRTLLRKDVSEWTEEDQSTIQSFPKLVAEAKKHIKKKEVASERLRECEDPPDLLDQKCTKLAQVISKARYLIIYTGAGISTSAKIPDYRGPNGIWTLLQKGEEVTQSLTDFSQSADPTLTHMAIKELWERGICKHIVSQNVDGLHLRSGIPKVALSEVHGNMYVEACVKCGREFVRLFDVTENTRRHHHKTGRCCYHCGNPLRDTIVLFGEKGSLRWPLNWAGAEYHVDKADVILCLGSSLKVLRRYPWLWCMSQPPQKRPKLYIVNLQWTPKDQFARLKINGKCDEVLEKVMSRLSAPVPQYSRAEDTIFSLASGLHPMELHTKSTTELSYPDQLPYPDKNKDLRNYIRFEPVFKVPVPYIANEESKSDVDIANKDSLSEDQPTDGGERVKKRQMNNSSWLGNAVVSKQNKKKKLK